MPSLRTDALCLQTGTKTVVFFEAIYPPEGNFIGERLDEARAICSECPVRRECLAEAMHYEQGMPAKMRAGMWGGLMPGQRRSIEDRKMPLACACGRAYDPLAYLTGELVCDVCGAKRKFIPVPDGGDRWNGRHTALAEQIVAYLIENVPVGELAPAPADLAELIGQRVGDVRRVYNVLVEDGTFANERIRGRKAFRRIVANAALASWSPPHALEQAV